MCIPHQWVSEDETGLVQNGNLVSFLQLSSLVPANDCVVYKRSVSREVLKNCDDISALLLGEEQAVAIRYGRRLEYPICCTSVTIA